VTELTLRASLDVISNTAASIIFCNNGEEQIKDNVRARVMQEDGTYLRLKPASADKAVDVQEFFMSNYVGKKS